MEHNRKFADFREFWPFYLSEHSNPTNRRWHFAGTGTGIILGGAMLVSGQWYLAPIGLIPGYLFAWVGHFGYQKNIPASFTSPWLSLRGDLYMFWRTLTGRIAGDYQDYKVEIRRFAAAARPNRTSSSGTSTSTASDGQ